MRKSSEKFNSIWDKYQIQALAEYNEKYHGAGAKFPTPRQLHDFELAPDGIEISSDGGVFEHNPGGLNYIGIVVTPFQG